MKYLYEILSYYTWVIWASTLFASTELILLYLSLATEDKLFRIILYMGYLGQHCLPHLS